MATADEQWWVEQAGEYVLGTLRGSERDVFETILKSDEEARQLVGFWQRELSALDAFIEPVDPPGYILPKIMDQIGQRPSRRERSSDKETDENRLERHNRQNDGGGRSRRSRSKTRQSQIFWKRTAGLAMAASVLMASLLVRNVYQLSSPPELKADFVSVIQSEQQEALWVLTTQSENNSVRAVAMQPPAIDGDQSYQLWMVRTDEGGVASVGLLPLKAGDSRAFILPLSTDDAQLFAVSLEPKGGSPEDVPTGPVVFTGPIITL